MDRSISLMDGEAVSDGTTTPTPEETEGGVFLSDPTSTSTNGGHFPDTSETTGRDGKTYAYVLSHLTPGLAQQTRKHQRAVSDSFISKQNEIGKQGTLSSLMLAQYDHIGVAAPSIGSPLMYLPSEMPRPNHDIQTESDEVGARGQQSTPGTDDDHSLRQDNKPLTQWSPLESLISVKVSQIQANSPMTQKHRSVTVSSEATSTGNKEKRSLHRLEKEIASYNEDSIDQQQAEPELVRQIFQDIGMRRTRATTTAMTCIARGEAPPPKKNLNLKNLSRLFTDTEEQMQEETDNDSQCSNAVPSEDTESDEETNYADYQLSFSGRGRNTAARSRSASYHPTLQNKSTASEVSFTQSIGSVIHGSDSADLGGFTGRRTRNSMRAKRQGHRTPSNTRTPSRTTENGIAGEESFSVASHAVAQTGACRSWEEWENQKNRITRILAAPGYAPTTTGSHITHAALQPYQALNDIPAGYSWRMDCDIHVFEPNLSVLQDFETFLKVVEEIAGRKVGVVKVVLPRLAVRPTEIDEQLHNKQLLPTQRFEMARTRTSPDTTVVYEVKTTQYGFEFADPHAIGNHDRTLSETWALVEGQERRVWKEPRFGTMLKEKSVVDRLASGVLASTDLEESIELRHSLRIKDLQLSKLPGNRLLKSNSMVPGVQSSKISVCHTDGVPVAMHCQHDATYSISYLHKGAPKCWTIVKPEDHQDLEGTVDLLTSGVTIASHGVQKPSHSPDCDQFIGHQALYMPSETLDKLGVQWKQVVQHENEMIITFPFAYRQAYSTGPNITEEISYASNRWDIFTKEDLYRQCGPSCPGGGHPMDLTFVKECQGHIHGHKQTAMGNLAGPKKRSRGDRMHSAASKKTTSPKGEASGRVSKKRQAIPGTRIRSQFRRNPTPTPNREDMEEEKMLAEVDKIFAKAK